MQTIPPPAFSFAGTPPGATPLVVSVPHAGRFYPAEIERLRAVPRATLETLEDRHADRLASGALGGAARLIVAHWARAWLDLNRDVDETDGALGIARARAGLGLLPARLGGRDLWRAPPDAAEAARRQEMLHRPYHAAITDALAAARRGFGFAILIDCHSMPPLGGRAAARIVIGDRHGASAAPHIAAAATRAVSRAGLPVARNAPYAGAYTLDRHGDPARGVHALQVEVDRSLYLDAALREPGNGLEGTAALVADIAWAAVEAADPDYGAQAAE